MAQFETFAQLSKVDVMKHEVWGYATTEVEDNAGETMHYGRSKKNFLKWSQGFSKATNGKSQGNLRAMHQPVAAGRVIHLDMRDATKQVYIGAEVVDENEWKKVLKGVYTGFSIGGKYGEVWTELGKKYYEAIPSEISLVDKSCNPEATFELIRMDGSTEMRKFDLEKHYGPGDHANGTPQSVHGGNAGDAQAREDIYHEIKRTDQCKEHGYSYQVGKHQHPTDGFMVSPYSERSYIKPPADITMEDVSNYLRTNSDLLNKPDHFAGGWIETGNAYLDVSIRAETLADAERIGKQFDQKAYYDIVGNKTVYVDYGNNPPAWMKDDYFARLKEEAASVTKSYQETLMDKMEKVFPPAKEKAPAETPPAEAAPAAAPESAKAPATPGAAPEGKAAPQEAAPAADDNTAALAIIDAGVKAGKIDPAVAEQLKAALSTEEQGEQTEDTAEGDAQPATAPLGTPDAGTPAGLPAQNQEKEMRMTMLSLLEELGLVERTDGGANKLEPVGMLHKADLESRDDLIMNKIDSVSRALASDFAKVAVEVEALEKRVKNISGMGPVMREIGSQNPVQINALAKADQLRNLLTTTSDPAEIEQLQLEITRLEIAGGYSKR